MRVFSWTRAHMPQRCTVTSHIQCNCLMMYYTLYTALQIVMCIEVLLLGKQCSEHKVQLVLLC